jgi:hypothetical protein
VTAHSPFDTERGAQARDTMLRLLAATGGAAGDFAGEVVAGRRQPHELLTHGPVVDEFVEEAREWWRLIDALPAEQRNRLAADAWTSLEQQVGELADLDVDAAVDELRELVATTPKPEPEQAPSLDDEGDYSDESPLQS